MSFDQCCKGVASTYNMRVGRADAVTGPYLDREGKPLLQGGGTLLQGKSGRFIGPGGQEAIVTSKGEMLTYHYYDGDDFGGHGHSHDFGGHSHGPGGHSHGPADFGGGMDDLDDDF